jgi:glycosyltransferase involved in cell wall biosynthesis
MLDLFRIFSKKPENRRLVIYDDYFPNLATGFRIAEYNYYLRHFPTSQVHSIDKDFGNHKKEYSGLYPQYRKRVKYYKARFNYPNTLIYTVFINNIFRFMPVIERQKLPFIFTLYPGGGFRLNYEESEKKIEKVLASPHLQKVIATQTITRDYLLAKNLCDPEKIELIYGGVLPSDYYRQHRAQKRKYRRDKDTFDICFVATKYTEKGIDKGYDTFIEVSRMLSEVSDDIRFHVVGNFTRDEIDVSTPGDRITFYGVKHLDFFPRFYASMDIILSPNIPFKFKPGSFDGFPTGSCVEAGMGGVAVLCTDELDLNREFVSNHDICIIPRNSQDICDIVLHYYRNLDDLYQLSENCRKSFLSIFNIDRQMSARIKIIEKCLGESEA